MTTVPLSRVKRLHAQLVASGLLRSSTAAASSLIELSAGADLRYAARLLRSLPFASTNHWNALIRGLALSPDPSLALLFLRRMIRAPRRIDALTCSFALKACARSLARPEATGIHALLPRLGFAADVILATTLLDAYAKVGDLDSAWKVFDGMPVRDVPSWNAMIAGLAQGSWAREALGLFQRMVDESGLRPDDVTALAALSACSQLGAIAEGEKLRRFLAERGLDKGEAVRNAIVDMYAKCGSVEKAHDVFRATTRETRTTVTWNTMIMGFAMHGEASRSLELFDEMGRVGGAGARPDGVSYLAALCACNHAGLVERGLALFRSMPGLGVAREVKHYGAVVDLLGRAGRVREAQEMVAGSASADAVLWQTLLGACKTHGDVEVAEIASQKLSEMGSRDSGDFVLLSNVYAGRRRWDDVKRVREAMKKKDVKKIPGFSFMEVDGSAVHRFVNGDRSHERWPEIYAKLDEISLRLGAYGCVARTGAVLHDIGEEDKENALCHHSEKLAVAFGLISTPEFSTIRVIKNLRICEDCHAVIKVVSKMFAREIIVRDRARFHKFKDGECSCRDYW